MLEYSESRVEADRGCVGEAAENTRAPARKKREVGPDGRYKAGVGGDFDAGPGTANDGMAEHSWSALGRWFRYGRRQQ